MLKLLAVAAVLVVAVAMAGKPLVTPELVYRVNSVQDDWVASTSSPMSHVTAEEAKYLFGHRQHKADFKRTLPRKTYTEADFAALPTDFDSRENWPDCDSIKQVRDQSHCGSCWAMGAVEAISDRECIFNKDNVALSAEIMLACSNAGDCEYGGYADSAWQYWVSDGLPTEACRPYSLPGCDHHIPKSSNPCPTNASYPTPKCVMQCVNGKSFKADLHYGDSVYDIRGEKNMMAELVNNGPFEVGFEVFDDFLAYTSGVYHHVSGESNGGHDVKLIGYGVDNGVKYWLIANSWNPHWGEKGMFRIRRGNDECGIEDDGTAGKPKSY